MLLIACGLTREARIFARPGVMAVPGGGDSLRLENLLEDTVRGFGPFAAILSAGIAGALDPALRPGDVVIGTTPERLPSDDESAVLLDTLQRRLPNAHTGTIIGSDRIVATLEDKRRLRAATGALAVDMESHVAARVAERHRLPLAILRTISDGADHVLPPAALVGMKPDGGMALGAVLASLARDPAQLPALIRTGRDAGRAFRALQRAFAQYYCPD